MFCMTLRVKLFYCAVLALIFLGAGRCLAVLSEDGFDFEGPLNEINAAEGVRYFTLKSEIPDFRQIVHVLELDPAKSPFEIESVFGKDCLYGKETVSSMARRKNAVAAINGAFFTQGGNPLGMTVHQGKIIKEPILGRTAFGIAEDGSTFFDNPKFDARFYFKDSRSDEPRFVELDGINRRPEDDEIVVYTPEFGNRTKTNSDPAIEVVVASDRVIAVGKANSLIPPDGYVIHAGGVMVPELENIVLNSESNMELYVNPVWEKARFAVGGGPRLICDGKIVNDASKEKFKSDVVKGRAPRTALGVNSSGKLLFVCVDGRQKKSCGMTLGEMARLMKMLGARDAMNLDGGGSTTLYLMGKVMNSPSDGCERPVSQALVLRPRPAEDIIARGLSTVSSGARASEKLDVPEKSFVLEGKFIQ